MINVGGSLTTSASAANLELLGRVANDAGQPTIHFPVTAGASNRWSGSFTVGPAFKGHNIWISVIAIPNDGPVSTDTGETSVSAK
jgi:hypothetical protein